MLNFESLVCNLPEDVLKRKWAGDFEGEIELIDKLLEKEMPSLLRDRLLVEREFAIRYPQQFCYSRAEALEMIKAKIPDFKDEELDALELDRAVEYIYIRGEKYYLHSFLDTLLKVNHAFRSRAGIAVNAESNLDKVIAEMKEKGELKYRIRIRGTLTTNSNEKVFAHMPVPQKCAQQSEIEIVPQEGMVVSEETYPQRTAFMELNANAPFKVEYEYTNHVKYVDPLNDKPSGIIYPDAPAPTEDDLAEQLPHNVFTPYLKALAKEIIGDETEKVKIAKKIYDYITLNVRYSYMRSYFLIENQAEYCALNMKGDCGIQALMFITLCRIAGIPARWQSGLGVEETTAGEHDWAQFYVEPFGWLFCDPSYGGGAHRNGAEERRQFYFGNLDPFRFVANSRYQTGFMPEKRFDRVDPYDNQTGEAETATRGLVGDELTTKYETLKFEKI